SFHFVGFNKQDVATGWRPGQAHRDSGALGALGNLGINTHLDSTQEFLNSLTRYFQLFCLSFRQTPGLLAAQSSNVTLQVAHSGLTGVMPDNKPYGILRNFDLLRLQAVLFDLPGHQVALSDVSLVIFRIALKLDDL